MHERDFRVSAGGFLSGFRYLIRNLAYHIREVDAGIPYPSTILNSKDEVAAKVLHRFQVADDIFLLQDGAAIRDVIVPNKDKPGTYTYYEGITHEFHRDLDMGSWDDIISVYFEWGKRRHTAISLENLVRYTDGDGKATKTLVNAFLHGTVEINGLVRQVQEDVQLEHTGYYAEAAERVIRAALDGNLVGFVPQYDQNKNPWKPMAIDQTQFNYYEVVNPPAPIDGKVLDSLAKAVRSDLAKPEMKRFQAAVEEWFPALFEPHKLKEENSKPSCSSSPAMVQLQL